MEYKQRSARVADCVMEQVYTCHPGRYLLSFCTKRIRFSLAPKAASSSHQNFSLELFPLRLHERGLMARVLF